MFVTLLVLFATVASVESQSDCFKHSTNCYACKSAGCGWFELSKKEKKKTTRLSDTSLKKKIGVRLAQEMTLVKDVNHQIGNQTAKMLQ